MPHPRPLLRAALLAAFCLLAAPLRAQPPAETLGDRFWLWCWPPEAVAPAALNLPGEPRITPVEAAAYLGLKRALFVWREGRPAVSFDQYFVPFRSLKETVWGLYDFTTPPADALGAYRNLEGFLSRNHLVSGLVLDDFFHIEPGQELTNLAEPVWASLPDAPFPLTLRLRLAQPVEPVRMQIRQPEGLLRAGTTAAEAAVYGLANNGTWEKLGQAALPLQGGAATSVTLRPWNVSALEIRLLRPHDSAAAETGAALARVRLWDAEGEVDLSGAGVEASSERQNAQAGNVLREREALPAGEAPALFSVAQLRALHDAQGAFARMPRRIEVVLYEDQLHDRRIAKHLEWVDVVDLFVRSPRNAVRLEQYVGALENLAPGKDVRVACYLYDFAGGGAMSPEDASLLCEKTRMLIRQGRVEGLIFVGSGVVDLNLPAVEWARGWIRRAGAEALPPLNAP